MLMEESFVEGLIKISKYAGMREDLVQAGGGNSSYKVTPDKMFIKASGYQLSEINANEGYAIVNPLIISRIFMECGKLEDITESESKKILAEAYLEGKRPSIETFLHAVTDRYTLHTHPVAVNILTCRVNGESTLKELFPEALYVRYATPGVALAKEYFSAYRTFTENNDRDVDIIFLQNHGLVVCGDSPEAVIEKTEYAIGKIERFIGLDLEKYHNVTRLFNLLPDGIVWCVTDTHVLNAFKELNGFWKHTFCPDCVVFMGKQALTLTKGNEKSELRGFMMKYGRPVIILYDDNIYIWAENMKKALEIQSVLSFSAQVMQHNQHEECSFLSSQEQNFLLNWDAEKYRKSMC